VHEKENVQSITQENDFNKISTNFCSPYHSKYEKVTTWNIFCIASVSQNKV